MKITFITGLFFLTLGLSPAMAQYVGPNGAPTSVKQLIERGRDYEPVVLKGNITSQSGYDDLYNFSDGSGTVLIKIDHKNWPTGLKIDQNTKVEITGKYDREYVGFSKIKVLHIRQVD